MVVILVYNAQTAQIQFITDGCDQQQGCAMMQQVIANMAQQGVIPTPSPVTGPPQPPPPPRPRNVRETITFPPKAPGA